MTDLVSTPSVETLYGDHHAWLQGWLRRKLGNACDAADLAQDTFMRVLGRPRELAELREPRAWLTTIAHLPEPQAPSPEAQLMLVEALVRIDAMLDGLAPKARSAFLLSRLEGLGYNEIARQLGVSLSSVEKYMATAIRHCLSLR
jgi:RNA polymerase sigma-70 factor (ECF subfamily)